MDTAIFRTKMKDDVLNIITHGLGAALSIAALVLLIVKAAMYGTVWHVVSFTIFGVSLIIMYSASTVYHSVRGVRPKYFTNILDHSAIYILIAGTYTPFALTALRGPWGWSLFGVIWALAIGGVIYKLFFINRYRLLSTIGYLLMGWIVIIAINPLLESVPEGGLLFLGLGGLSYCFGVIFYLWRKLPFSHAIWHLFVLGGSIMHFFAVYLYLVP